MAKLRLQSGMPCFQCEVLQNEELVRQHSVICNRTQLISTPRSASVGATIPTMKINDPNASFAVSDFNLVQIAIEANHAAIAATVPTKNAVLIT